MVVCRKFNGMNSILRSVAVVLSLMGASASGSSAPEEWFGTLNMGSFAKDVSFNVTIIDNTASATWIYDKDAGGNVCRRDTETGLVVTRSGSTVTFKGTDKDPSYYSFAAELSAANDTMSGAITHAGKPQGKIALKNTPPATIKH